MLYKEIISVCTEIHTQHTKATHSKNTEVVYVRIGGT